MKSQASSAQKHKWVSVLSLFTSSGTLICCAFPAAMVTLGMGASLAGLVSRFPQLVWLSEQKYWIFSVGGILLALGAYLQWLAKDLPCPTDPQLAATCDATRRRSLWIYGVSVVLYVVGFTVAFVL